MSATDYRVDACMGSLEVRGVFYVGRIGMRREKQRPCSVYRAVTSPIAVMQTEEDIGDQGAIGRLYAAL